MIGRDITTIDDKLYNYLAASSERDALLLFNEPRSDSFWQELDNKILKEFDNHIRIKFDGNFGQDFSFLSFLTHLKSLSISTYRSIHLDTLPQMTNIRYMSMGDVDWTEYSLDFLCKLKNVERLAIGGSFVDAENVQLLPELTSLTFTYNDKVLDYGFFKEMTTPKRLHIMNHEFVTNLSPIGNLKDLPFLRLYNLPQLKNVDFLADMQGLEVLELTLPALQKFPVLSARPPIKRLVLEEIPLNCDFSAVAHLTSLEEFYIKETDANPKMLMQVLEQLPHLKRARFEVDDDNWDKVNAYLASRGIDHSSGAKSSYN